MYSNCIVERTNFPQSLVLAHKKVYDTGLQSIPEFECSRWLEMRPHASLPRVRVVAFLYPFLHFASGNIARGAQNRREHKTESERRDGENVKHFISRRYQPTCRGSARKSVWPTETFAPQDNHAVAAEVVVVTSPKQTKLSDSSTLF